MKQAFSNASVKLKPASLMVMRKEKLSTNGEGLRL